MPSLLAPLMALSLVTAPVNFEARMLAAHNKVRAAAGVPGLTWNADLAADAVAWGRRLAAEQRWEHDPDNRREGENLWMGTAGAFTLEEMVGGWAGEGRDYRPGAFPNVSRTGSWHDVGHYTQMVWRNTTEVGCGLVRGGGNDYLVCRYAPAGNVMGERAY